MEHRFAPLFSRIYDEHREFLAHGAGIPIRRVPDDAGTVAICGDRDQLDRRGRHAVTYVRPDQRLVILDLVDAADEAEHCAQYQHADLADLEPFTVLFRGKPRHFQATTKSFLMGACECGDATILVSGLDGGLAFNIRTREGWSCVLEPRPSWTTPIDLDAELGGRRSRASKPRARARAVREPSAGWQARARDVDEFDDEVREHHARLCHGVTADPDGLEILAICFQELSREAMLPHDCFEGNHKSRKHLEAVVDGILYAVAGGCGNLGGRESDMRAQLRSYGVVLPPGALSGVLRLFHLLGCPLVSQPKPAKDRKFSKRYYVDVKAALDTANPKHLELLRWMPTPFHPRAPVEPQDREGNREADEPRKNPTPASDPQSREPAESPRPPASEPGGEAGVGADPSAKRTRSTVLPEQWQAFMQLTLGALTLLASQVTILHQRLEATEHAAPAAATGQVETATAAEPPCVADVVSTATAADGRIDPDAAITVGADERPGDQRLAATDGPVENVDADVLGEPRPDDDVVAPATGEDGQIDFDVVGIADASQRPGRTGLNDAARARLHLDHWSFASSVFRAQGYVKPLAMAHRRSAYTATARRISWPMSEFGAGASIEDDGHGDVWSEQSDPPPSQVITDMPLPKQWTLTLDRWNFATVMFLVMFELEDPYLVRVVVLKVIAWMADADGRVALTCGAPWPRALDLAGTRPQFVALACVERLAAIQPWVPAPVEFVDAGPRGPPPLGC